MCGIVGYIGAQPAAPILLDGLAQLEYRGYDSAGVAVLGNLHSLHVHKGAGRVRELSERLPADFEGTEDKLSCVRGHHVGIGHTRWATHGAPSDDNAHPHTSQDGRIAVVHNGILDNAPELRATLVEEGVSFRSETDTEVLAHLIARSRAQTLEEAVVEAVARVQGTYGIAVLDRDHPDRIVVARNGSPIIIGVAEHEVHVASDVAALVRYTRQVVHLEDGELATLTPGGFHTYTADARTMTKAPVTVDWEPGDLSRGDHEHFMVKEIREQPEAVWRCLQGRIDHRHASTHLGGLNLTAREIRALRRVKILGCGSAYYAGLYGAHVLESVARIPATAEPSSEFKYRDPVIEPDTLFVAMSQSGETYDTLTTVQELERRGGSVIGLVNVVGSSIARACTGGIYLHAGPEVAVASTKAVTNMCVALALLAVHVGRIRDLSPTAGERLLGGLEALPRQIEQLLADTDQVSRTARWISKAGSVYFVGRVRGYPTAREGAQKLKEIAYLHAEAYQTSELKHGPLALVSPDLPTVAVVPDDELLDRNLTALREIAARSGPLAVVTHEGVDLDGLARTVIRVPRNEPELDPILLNIPLQLLAYEVARELGTDVDKPRNLAKSVTVE